MRKYLLKHKVSFILTCLVVVVQSILSVFIAFMLKNCIDAASSNNYNKFIKAILIYGLYILLMVAIDIIKKIVQPVYIRKTMTYLKNDIFSHILNKDIRNFTEENSAKYISILSNDINMIETDYLGNIVSLIWSITTFVVAIISVVYINGKLALTTLIVGIFGFIIPQIFGKILSNKKVIYSNSLETLTTKTKDILSGFEVIRNFDITWKANELFNQNNIDVENKKQKFSIISGIVDSITSFIGTCMFIIPMIAGGYLVYIGSITVGSLIALIQLMNNLAFPLSQSLQIMNKLKSINGIASKIDDITKVEKIENWEYNLNDFSKEIELKGINFSYNNNVTVLEGINIKFVKGKKYAIVGASGSGKSTLLRILLRYYEPQNGEILIDGFPYNKVKIADIYKQITFIQQNIFMFDGTIRENITLYQDYDDSDVLKVCKLAGLSKMIENLPNGIYENIGESGCKLSGGEKQRISIARALLRQSSLMLLDETTSALDNEIAYSIEKSLLQLDGLTLIVVTHKIIEDLLKHYDEIIVMKNGMIIETGSFKDLYELKGYFYSLYNVEEAFEINNSASVM